jgi:hypothetical protein
MFIKLVGVDGNKVLVNMNAIQIVYASPKSLSTEIVCGPITLKVKDTVDEISTILYEHMQKSDTKLGMS